MRGDDFSHVTLTFSMPRNRTQWLTWLFRHCGYEAWHDPLGQCSSPAELVRRVRSWQWGTQGPLLIVDTGAIFFHNQLRNMLHGCKVAYMFRHPAAVDDSLYKHTGRRQRALLDDQIERLYRYGFGEGCFRMFDGMIDKRMPEFWQFVTGSPMPEAVVRGYDKLRKIKIDVPPPRQPRDMRKHAQLARYKEQ